MKKVYHALMGFMMGFAYAMGIEQAYAMEHWPQLIAMAIIVVAANFALIYSASRQGVADAGPRGEVEVFALTGVGLGIFLGFVFCGLWTQDPFLKAHAWAGFWSWIGAKAASYAILERKKIRACLRGD